MKDEIVDYHMANGPGRFTLTLKNGRTTVLRVRTGSVSFPLTIKDKSRLFVTLIIKEHDHETDVYSFFIFDSAGQMFNIGWIAYRELIEKADLTIKDGIKMYKMKATDLHKFDELSDMVEKDLHKKKMRN